RRLLESLARQQPVILYIDDLQWAQPTLLDLLDHLVDLSRGAPILVLCLARPELLDDRPGWAGGKLRATSILLEPLGIEDCEALLAELDDELDADVRAQAMATSGGNPLFLEELVALARERGAVMLPPTIQALLAARIERLPLEEREVLERGAIEGEVFHRSAVRALAQGAASAEGELPLASLLRKELIRAHPPTLAQDDAFRFRHLLMRDVVYDGLPKAVRARLHERFAHWLLEEAPGELVERDEIAGWHLEQAVHYERELGREARRELLMLATDQLRAAGRRARRRADVPAATTFLERALALVPDDDAGRAVISAELAEQLMEAGEFDRAGALLASADRGPETSTLVALARLRWLMHARTSQAPEAIRTTLPAIIERLRVTDDHEELARAHLAKASLDWLQGHADETAAGARLAAQHASRAQHRGLQEQALKWYLAGLWFGTTPASTIERDIARLEQEQPGPFLSSEMDIARAELERFRGHFRESVDLLRRAIDTFRALGRYDTMAGTGMQVAKAELLAGDAAAAVKALLTSDAALAELGERGLRSTIQAWLARAYEQLGNRQAARAAITLAETLSAPDDVINFVITHGVRARLALHEGHPEDAERWARSSVKHAYMTDSIDDQGHTRLNLAYVLASVGRNQEAIEEALAANGLFAAKGDEFGGAQARVLLNQLGATSTSAV
ncbi:MAG: ATP-binding protein, partial [Solirubrobacteraceae bacterium]